MPLLPLGMIADVFPGVLDLPGQLGERTLEEYRMDVQHYLAWCGFEQDRALDPQTLRSWRQHMVEHTGLSPHTINRRLSAVKRLVRASVAAEALDQGVAFRFGLVERVPLFSLRQRLRQHRPVTPDQIRELCRSPGRLSAWPPAGARPARAAGARSTTARTPGGPPPAGRKTNTA